LKLQILYLKLLALILWNVMNIKESMSGSRYSWTKENAVLQEAHDEINEMERKLNG
jgi:hypothetical protein